RKGAAFPGIPERPFAQTYRPGSPPKGLAPGMPGAATRRRCGNSRRPLLQFFLFARVRLGRCALWVMEYSPCRSGDPERGFPLADSAEGAVRAPRVRRHFSLTSFQNCAAGMPLIVSSVLTARRILASRAAWKSHERFFRSRSFTTDRSV